MSACTLLVRCGCAGGGKGALVSDEVSLTLSTSNTQTLFSEEGGDMVVRRLTPRECERLQGFPDDWTKIPYRGKLADECPDGPRYKAVGTSKALDSRAVSTVTCAVIDGRSRPSGLGTSNTAL